jgi:ribosomal-protein-alanine N-acetyltransferase
MTEQYLEGVLAIENASFSRPWSKEMFRGEFTNPVSNAFVARLSQDGVARVVGYTVYWVVVGEGHIMNISVAPRSRRCGIGRRLLRFTLDFMEQGRVTVVFLEVRRTNYAAIKLYQDYGFTEIYVRKKYYGDEDALVMRLDLGEHSYPGES